MVFIFLMVPAVLRCGLIAKGFTSNPALMWPSIGG